MAPIGIDRIVEMRFVNLINRYHIKILIILEALKSALMKVFNRHIPCCNKEGRAIDGWEERLSQ